MALCPGEERSRDFLLGASPACAGQARAPRHRWRLYAVLLGINWDLDRYQAKGHLPALVD